MTKQEAAELLGCSERQIERYVKDGKLSVTMKKGKTRPTPDFNENELRELKAELEKPIHKAIVARHEIPTGGDNNDAGLSLLPSEPQLAALRQLFEAMSQKSAAALPEATEKPQKPLASIQDAALKLLLTADEAAAFAGVGRRAIDNAIKAGQLTAHRGLGQGRRIKRADLEAWVKKL